MSDPATAATRAKANWWTIVKPVLFLAVAAYVIRHGWQLWRDVDEHPARVNWGWVAASGLCSTLAWLPPMFYWRWLLAERGHRIPAALLGYSYFAGHMGKYVPGKAAAVAVRCWLLRSVEVPLTVSGLTAVRETLVNMAVGLSLVFLLFPWLGESSRWAQIVAGIVRLDGWRGAAWWLIGAALACGALHGGTFLIGRVARKTVGVKEAAADGASDWRSAERNRFSRTCLWFVILQAGWWMHGLAVACAVMAVTERSLPNVFSRLPVWTAAASAGTTAGFFALIAPGGLAVREGFVMDLTAPVIGSAPAVLVAVLSRVALFTGELQALAVAWLWWRLRSMKHTTKIRG